jgi:hypothetical protein
MEDVGEDLVGQFLEVLYAVLGKLVESVPSLVIELNALAGHGHLHRDVLAVPDGGGDRYVDPPIPRMTRIRRYKYRAGSSDAAKPP